jgi:hypothetical protein
MAYIGKQPVVGNFVKLDTITTSATATYNLLNGGVAYFPQTANNCIVSLNGVIQSPTSAYTISGSTIVFSDALTSSDTIDFILVLGDVLSIGTPSDGTITSAKLASGTDGLFAWQSVQTTGFTAVAARAYPCNTTSSAFTVTLPASPSVGDQVLLLDYAGTFDTNAITLAPNGNKINGSTSNRVLNTEREAVTITYVDSTQGWLASSGVNEGTVALSPPPYSVDFLVIAGGGGGGTGGGGGAGGGGYRSSNATYGNSGGGASAESSLTFNSGVVYTITVGAGGTATNVNNTPSNNGSSSSISGSDITTITSSGGGGGGRGGNGVGTTSSAGASSATGGGGGGYDGGVSRAGGSGTSGQGYAGGSGNANDPYYGGGGGGGSGSAGGNGSSSAGGTAGAGTASTITGSSVTRSAGTAGSGATGSTGSAGTANTGNGGGASPNGVSGATGGSGVVILRMPTASYSSTTTGSPTVSTSGSDTILTYTGSGTYTG